MTASDLGELRYHDDVLVILVRRSVLALAWYDAPRSGHLLEVLRQVQAVHRATQVSPCLYNVVVRGTPRFPDQVREEGGRLVRDTAEFKSATAHIIEVEGFAGTATRMFLSTMLLVARHRPRVRVFGEHREGAKWLEQVNGAGVTSADFLRLYEQLKSIEPKSPTA
jgi:hypothetical protein